MLVHAHSKPTPNPRKSVAPRRHRSAPQDRFEARTVDPELVKMQKLRHFAGGQMRVDPKSLQRSILKRDWVSDPKKARLLAKRLQQVDPKSEEGRRLLLLFNMRAAGAIGVRGGAESLAQLAPYLDEKMVHRLRKHMGKIDNQELRSKYLKVLSRVAETGTDQKARKQAALAVANARGVADGKSVKPGTMKKVYQNLPMAQRVKLMERHESPATIALTKRIASKLKNKISRLRSRHRRALSRLERRRRGEINTWIRKNPAPGTPGGPRGREAVKAYVQKRRRALATIRKKYAGVIDKRFPELGALKRFQKVMAAAALSHDPKYAGKIDRKKLAGMMRESLQNPHVETYMRSAYKEAVASFSPAERKELVAKQREYLASPKFRQKLKLLSPEERADAIKSELRTVYALAPKGQKKQAYQIALASFFVGVAKAKYPNEKELKTFGVPDRDDPQKLLKKLSSIGRNNIDLLKHVGKLLHNSRPLAATLFRALGPIGLGISAADSVVEGGKRLQAGDATGALLFGSSATHTLLGKKAQGYIARIARGPLGRMAGHTGRAILGRAAGFALGPWGGLALMIAATVFSGNPEKELLKDLKVWKG